MATTLPLPTSTPARLIVPVGGRSTTVVEIAAHTIAIDGVRVRFDSIDSIAYSTRAQRANLVQQRIRRRVWIRADDAVLQLRLGEQAFGHLHDEVRSLAHHSVVGALHDNVERRLRARIVTRLRDGDEVRIGPLRIERVGVTLVDRSGVTPRRAWREAPIAELCGHEVRLTEGRDGRVLGRIDADTPDAVLLPELLLSCAAAFG